MVLIEPIEDAAEDAPATAPCGAATIGPTADSFRVLATSGCIAQSVIRAQDAPTTITSYDDVSHHA